MNIFILKVNGIEFESSRAYLTGRGLLKLASLEPPKDYELLKKVNEKGFEPIQLEEEVDLREPGIEGFTAKPYKKLVITIDEAPFEVEECFISPKEL